VKAYEYHSQYAGDYSNRYGYQAEPIHNLSVYVDSYAGTTYERSGQGDYGYVYDRRGYRAEGYASRLAYLNGYAYSSQVLAKDYNGAYVPVGQNAERAYSNYEPGYRNSDQYGVLLIGSKANKLRFETIASIAWQWDNNPVSVLTAIKDWSSNWEVALNTLKGGQVNNPEAQRLYDVASKTLPDFWDLVFYTTWSQANFSSLQSALGWQAGNEWDSLVQSQKSWTSSPKQEIWAYYHLLWGQRNNPQALKTYRACWKSNRSEVMAMVGRTLGNN
jgi:hypothetical protein